MALVTFEWDEDKHPRVPAGSPGGGEFEGDQGGTAAGPRWPPEFLTGAYWHGTPSGKIEHGEQGDKVAPYGIHVGSYQAAKEALEARIGKRADGKDWDGTQEYGKTLLKGYQPVGNTRTEPGTQDHYPSGAAVYSDGTPVPLDAKPDLFPVHIVGEMTNSPANPMEDFKANGYMHGQITRGTARRGYYYTEVGEDAGSIAAVVPARTHLQTYEDWKAAQPQLRNEEHQRLASAYGPSDAELLDQVKGHARRTGAPVADGTAVLPDGSHISSEPLFFLRDVARKDVTAAGVVFDFDESKHPRVPAGSSAGGEFEGGQVMDDKAGEPLANGWKLTPDEFAKSAPAGQRWVFHSTTYHQNNRDDLHTLLHEGVQMENVPQNLARQRYEQGDAAEYQPGAGVGQGLYVVDGNTDTSGYGKWLVGITVKDSDLAVPPESTVPSGTVDAALADHNGALIIHDIPPEQVHYFGRHDYSNFTAHQTLVYNAAKNGAVIPAKVRDAYLSDAKTPRALREILTGPVTAAAFGYDPNEPRDEKGRWDSAGGAATQSWHEGGAAAAMTRWMAAEKTGGAPWQNPQGIRDGKYPGIRVDPNISGGLAGHAYDPNGIVLSPKQLDDPVGLKLLITHEMGHLAASPGVVTAEDKAGLAGLLRDVPTGGTVGDSSWVQHIDNPFGGSRRLEEVYADTYSALMHPGWVRFGDPQFNSQGPGSYSGSVRYLVDRVQGIAAARGFPTGTVTQEIDRYDPVTGRALPTEKQVIEGPPPVKNPEHQDLRASAFGYDPNEARDDHGRWTDDGGDTAEVAGTTITLTGRPDGTGTPDDPIYVGDDLNRAIELLAQNKSIRLSDKKVASLLVAKLGPYAEELKAKTGSAPPFNLCNVTVESTNLFCEGSKNVPRIEMPQLRGVAEEGSPAAGKRKDPTNPNERVQVEPEFEAALLKSGVDVVDKTVHAGMLRATQNELNGGKVGRILDDLLTGRDVLGGKQIWTTKDGYVLDGHHRWAAGLAQSLLVGGDGGSVAVHEVQMEIGATLDFARAFVKEQGIRQLDASTFAIVRLAALLQARDIADAEQVATDIAVWITDRPPTFPVAGGAAATFEWDPDKHPRDDHGRWDSTGGSGDGKAAWARTEKLSKLIVAGTGAAHPFDLTDTDRSAFKAQIADARAADLQRLLGERPALRAEFDRQMAYEYHDGKTHGEGLQWKWAHQEVLKAQSAGDRSAATAMEASSISNWQPILDWANSHGGIPPVEALWAQDTATRYVNHWADTAADTSGMALALQHATAEELGAHSASFDAYMQRIPTFAREQYDQVHGIEAETMKAFARAEYDATQKYLADAGFKPGDQVALYRGMKFGGKGDVGAPPAGFPTAPGTATVPIDLNPASSWTVEGITARMPYFSGVGGYLLTDHVPVRDIISTPRTGRGSALEGEIVVRNRPGQTAQVERL